MRVSFKFRPPEAFRPSSIKMLYIYLLHILSGDGSRQNAAKLGLEVEAALWLSG